MNIIRISVLITTFAVVNIILLHVQQPLVATSNANSETTTTTSIDNEIELVEGSLDGVQRQLLDLIANDPANRMQFEGIDRHISTIRDQLQLIQQEYHLNRDLDQFRKRLTSGGGGGDGV